MKAAEQAAVHAQVLTAGLQQGQTRLALITSPVSREKSMFFLFTSELYCIGVIMHDSMEFSVQHHFSTPPCFTFYIFIILREMLPEVVHSPKM